MKILIFTEGSWEIGFGHITRCTSFYQAFEDIGITPLLVINGDKTVEYMLHNRNYKLFNWIKNKKDILYYLKDSDIVIIDSYLASIDIYNDISKYSVCSVFVDDNKRLNYPESIVINGTVNAQILDYPKNPKIKYLIGSQYIPLRRDFWDANPIKVNDIIQTILITLGGDDLRNLTPKILQMLTEKLPNVNKKVIIGKAFRNIKEIEKLKDSKTDIIYYPNAKGMLEIMQKSDIAISAGGQTLYELARVGVPTIAISVASNQINNVINWKKKGFIEYAGFWDDYNIMENIIYKIRLLNDKNLRVEKSKIGKKYVDGLGAIRVVKLALIEYLKNQKSILRPAMIKDILNVYRLSNEKVVRENSFKQEEITLKEHKNWFMNKLSNEKNLFLIAEIDNIFLGQIRFEMSGNNALVSVSITKEFRDIGLGRIMLKDSIKIIKSHFPNIKGILAHVKIENEHSKKFFESFGFKYLRTFAQNNHKAFEYIFNLEGENIDSI